jgi:hypothetical protein
MRKDQVYRQQIDLNRYDFSIANAYLLASVNGRFPGDESHRYG